MISDEFTRLDAITVFLNLAHGSYTCMPWCTGCDFILWFCTERDHDSSYRIDLTRQEAIDTFCRVLGVGG